LGALAGTGLLVALYLTLYQWNAWGVWDPFFDSSKVLDLTEPVPDALAGVIAYGAELLLLALGGRDRWRSLPWTCLALAAVLSAGAFVSIGLIVVQPTVAGGWCTLCLVSAAISLALFGIGVGEGLAAWQHIRRATEQGHSFGDAFWGRAAQASLASGESAVPSVEPEIGSVDAGGRDSPDRVPAAGRPEHQQDPAEA
jgi:hypothetical protein